MYLPYKDVFFESVSINTSNLIGLFVNLGEFLVRERLRTTRN